MSETLPTDRLRVVAGSTNPVKQQAARDGFAAMFPHVTLDILGLEAPSGVSDQPFGDVETLQGALNRARYTLQAMLMSITRLGSKAALVPSTVIMV